VAVLCAKIGVKLYNAVPIAPNALCLTISGAIVPGALASAFLKGLGMD